MRQTRTGRRQFLRRAGLAGGLAATGPLAGCVGRVRTPRAAGAARHGMAFDYVLDAVDDLGMDPTGEAVIEPQLPALDRTHDVPPNTLIEFPAGEYRLSRETRMGGLGNIGFRGLGDVTLIASERHRTANMYLFNIEDTDGILFENFTIDQTGERVLGAFRLHPRVDLQVHDVVFEGRGLLPRQGGEIIAMNLSIRETEGTGVVDSYVSKQGSAWAKYQSGNGRIGVYTGANHWGTLTLRNLDLREFGNNALYTSRTAATGNIRIEDSYFENNNAASVRISGEGSYVENSTIVNSLEKYTGPRTHEDGSFALRPIVIEQRTNNPDRRKAAGCAVRNVEIIHESGTPAGPPAIHAYPNSRSLSVENCRIEYNEDPQITGPGPGPSALVMRGAYRTSLGGNYPPGEPPRWLRMSDTTITGDCNPDRVVAVMDADGTRVENCSIDVSGATTDGIYIAGSDEATISNTNVSVGGEATEITDSTVTTDGLTDDEDCPEFT